VGYEDAGSISIKSGRAEIKDNKVVSAEAIIDMATIKTLKSGKGKDEDKLTGHLKSEDFFNVEQYPTSELKISQAKLVSDSGGTQNYEFSGSLTMKGITAEVVFPGTVTFLGDKVTMQSETKLDRTKWGVNFGSSKLADSFIDDLFTLKIYIEAVIVK
jgi:polyisoprenoid-binding protein YceI